MQMVTVNIKYFGFTLAEVLITLGIIGVVAAMTLPAVINNTHNKQMETALKKGYSIAQQALTMMTANSGDVKPENFPTRTFVTEYIKNFNNAIDCGIAWNATAKDLSVSSRDIANYKNFNNTTAVFASYFDDGQFGLPDGMTFFIQNERGQESDDLEVNRTNTIMLIIDVNGSKKRPNQLGHDVFAFQFMNNGKLMPMGVMEQNF